MDRRSALKLFSSVVVGAGAFTYQRLTSATQRQPIDLFLDLHTKYSDANAVAKHFVQATSPDLMVSYTAFYTDFMNLNGFESVKLLEGAIVNTKQKFSNHHHRLDSLPSVAAAHLLKYQKDPDKIFFLSSYVLKGLKDQRREVKEIIMQNLVTSVVPNVDTFRFYHVHSNILVELHELIKEAEVNEKLLSACSLSVEFLLNIYSQLLQRVEFNYKSEFESIFDFITCSKSPHFWVLKEQIRIHQLSFRPSPTLTLSLPPQSSEALMGWMVLPGMRDYIQILAVIRLRNIFTVYRTVTGELSEDNTMSKSDAVKALPKGIFFFKNFNIMKLIESFDFDSLPSNENEFKRFAVTKFPALLKNPDKHIDTSGYSPPSEEELNLGSLVPFNHHMDKSFFNRLQLEKGLKRRESLSKVGEQLINSVGWGTSTYLGESALQKLIKEYRNQEKLTAKDKNSIELANEDIEKRNKDIDDGKYRGIDEQQDDLGDLPET